MKNKWGYKDLEIIILHWNLHDALHHVNHHVNHVNHVNALHH